MLERIAIGVSSEQFTLGTPRELTLSARIPRGFQPTRIVTNSPQFGFAVVKKMTIRKAGMRESIALLTDLASFDAHSFSALACGLKFTRLPAFEEGDEIAIECRYDGSVPPGYGVSGNEYIFVVSFQ